MIVYIKTSPRFTSPRFTCLRFTCPRFASPVQSKKIQYILDAAHPRRPRGYKPGHCYIFGRKFTLRAEEPWELILTEPVPDVVKFRPANWAEKYFLPNQR